MRTELELTSAIKMDSNQFIAESCFQLGSITNNTLCNSICLLRYAKGIRGYGTNILVCMLNDMYIIGILLVLG